MVKCETCLYYQGRGEHRVPTDFIIPREGPGFGSVTSFAIVCQHPFCFVNVSKTSPEKGQHVVKQRVRGQAQMNKHNDCRYYSEVTLWDLFSGLFGYGRLRKL